MSLNLEVEVDVPFTFDYEALAGEVVAFTIDHEGFPYEAVKTNSILVSSANQPKKADPIPPSPNINPKNIPEIIPILSGFKSVA